MNTVKAMMLYEYRSYLKSNQYTMPLIALGLFLYVNYSGLPISIVASSTISMVAVFFIAIWAGMSYYHSENAVSEQLIILKLQSEGKYYLCKTLFLFLLSMSLSLIVILVPLLQNVLNHFQAFVRPLTVSDILIAYVLLCISAFTGMMLGSVFHPRIMRNRNLAGVLAVIFAAMAILKTSVESDFPIFRFVSWLFPPVADFMHRFSGMEHYSGPAVLSTVLTLLSYSFVLMVIKIYFLVRNKF